MAPVSPLAPHGATTRIGKSGSGHFPRQPKIPGRDQEFGVSARQARAPAPRGLASYLICFPEVIGEGRKLNSGCVTGEGGCRARTSRCRWDARLRRTPSRAWRLTSTTGRARPRAWRYVRAAQAPVRCAGRPRAAWGHGDGRAGGRSYIGLHDLGALPRTCVTHAEGDIDPVRTARYCQIRVFEPGVRQAVAERKQRLDVLLVVPAVANRNTF